MKRPREEGGAVDANLAALLMLLSGAAAGASPPELPAGRVFECRTCNRQFPSFQALGGHRASHKKPRAADSDAPPPRPAKPRVHECSICGLEFSLGQALGGHMRRHRAELEAGAVRLRPPAESKPREEEEEESSGLTFDLNAPAPPESDPMLALCLGLPLVH